jgi:Raf kinase inhibitor-like YbhB/YbcL family protein
MNRRTSLLATLSLVGAAALGASLYAGEAYAEELRPIIGVSSPDFTNGGAIPKKNTCDGRGASPQIDWSSLPAGTKSVAIVVDDPDAPRGTFVNWIVYDVAPDTTTIGEGSGTPKGAKPGKNGNGKLGWTAPCPPSGAQTHNYRFKVYALNDTLRLDKPSEDDLDRAMTGKIIGQGEIVGTYERAKPKNAKPKK